MKRYLLALVLLLGSLLLTGCEPTWTGTRLMLPPADAGVSTYGEG